MPVLFPVTSAPSLGERETHDPAIELVERIHCSSKWEKIIPLPWEEGWAEGKDGVLTAAVADAAKPVFRNANANDIALKRAPRFFSEMIKKAAHRDRHSPAKFNNMTCGDFSIFHPQNKPKFSRAIW